MSDMETLAIAGDILSAIIAMVMVIILYFLRDFKNKLDKDNDDDQTRA